MSTLHRRVQTLEDDTGMSMSMREALLDAKISEERVREVTDPDGEIDMDLLTDEELEAVAGDSERVFPGGPKWEELTDEQLERIAAGEGARNVLG